MAPAARASKARFKGNRSVLQVMGGWGEGGPLASADARVLRVLFEHPDWSAEQVAVAASVSPSSAAKARARLRSAGLWAPWFDVDLKAAGAGPFIVFMGRCNGDSAVRFVEAAVPRILAARAVPGIFVAEGDQIYGVTMPKSIDEAASLETSLLQAVDPDTNTPWLFNAKFAPIAADGAPAIDYRAFVDIVLPGRSSGTRGWRAAGPGAGGIHPRPLTAREVEVLSFVVRNPNASLAEASTATGVAPRTFARAKAKLLSAGVLRPSARMHLPRMGFTHLLVSLLRHRPDGTRARRLRSITEALEGGATLAAFSSPPSTMIVAAFRSAADAEAAEHRIGIGLDGLEWLEPPVSFVFSYAGLRRAGFSAEGDPSSAWIQAIAESPSVGRLRAGHPAGSLLEAHREPLPALREDAVRQKPISGQTMEQT
jgi:hypothetical protein